MMHKLGQLMTWKGYFCQINQGCICHNSNRTYLTTPNEASSDT